MLFYVMHHPMDAETHNISPGEQERKGFSVGIRCLGGRGLHTTRSIDQIFWGVVFNVSSRMYDFCCGSNCMCRLGSFMSAVTSNSEAWSGFFEWLL